MTRNQLSSLMEGVGSRFKRDVMLNDEISGAQNSIGLINGALNELGSGKEDQNIRSTLLGLISSYNKKIEDAKKEQEEITKKYGR